MVITMVLDWILGSWPTIVWKRIIVVVTLAVRIVVSRELHRAAEEIIA